MPRTIRPTTDNGSFADTGSIWDYRGAPPGVGVQATTIQISLHTSADVNVWLNGFISFGIVTDAQRQFIANWGAQPVTQFPGDYLYLVGVTGQATVGSGISDFDAPYNMSEAVSVYYVDWSGNQVMFTYPSSGADFSVFGGARVLARIGSLQLDSAVTPLPEVVNLTVANLFGTAGDDTLVGGVLGHTLIGNDGNDTLTAQGDRDWLDGGNGADRLSGGAGMDTLIGGLGPDMLTGGSDARDVPLFDGLVHYWMGDDFYYNSFAESSESNQSVDLITDFQTGVDRIRVSPEVAPVTSYSITQFGGEYIVRLGSSDGVLTIRSTNPVSPADIQANSQLNLVGGPQNDTLFGLAGNDTLTGGDGDDTLWGFSGNDNLYGGTGNDRLISGAGNDHLYGDAGDDFFDLSLSGASTVAEGGSGTDIFYYGTENYNQNIGQINGGEGFDTLLLQGPFSQYALNLVSVEEILLQSSSITRWGHVATLPYSYSLSLLDASVAAGQQLLVDGRSLLATEQINFNGGGETDGRFLIYGGQGDDSLGGGGGDDVIDGGDGNDALYGGGGDNILIGGAGNDNLFGGEGHSTLTGGAGVDGLSGGIGQDTFRDSAAGLNGDSIWYLAANDRIIITDATLAGFTFDVSGSMSGSLLTFTGGSLNLAYRVVDTLVASAAAGGGVQLSVRALAHDVVNDFNGDGRSDILWRNVTTGQFSDWLGQANGGFVGNDANAFATVPTSWTIVGTGDFNGDGRDDVLWRNANGQLSDWLGNANGGFTPNDVNALTTVPISWNVVGTGDFNGDGRSDILWRNSNGQLSDWLGQANGGFVGNDANAFTSVPTNWHVAGTGDFNGDGRDDVLWRDDAGQLSDWLGSANGGFTPNDANAFASAPTSWHIVGTGDFNGDGRDDILWRSDAGQLSNWLGQANGGFVGNDANAFTTVPTSWTVVAVGDYNGDGRDDILWRNSNGQLSDWLGQANGGFVGNDANAFISVPTNWVVQPEAFVL